MVIEAWPVKVLLDQAKNDWKALPSCIQNEYDMGNITFCWDRLEIKTLEGIMTANIGDWIIKGINGEFYPCKNDIFQKTYEEVMNEETK